MPSGKPISERAHLAARLREIRREVAEKVTEEFSPAAP
jgi:hypothetical protein